MKVVSFGSYTFPTVEPRDAFSGVEAPSPLTATAYGPVDTLGSEPVDFGNEMITKEFDLIASTPSALATALHAVRALRGTRALLTLQDYAGVSFTSYARCVAVPYTRTNRNFNAQRIACHFVVEQNLWNGAAQDVSAGKTTGQTITMTNGGNANVDDLRVEITAPAGNAITNIIISATTPGISVRWNDSLAASKILVLDSGEWLITDDGVDSYANLSLQDPHAFGHLFRLLPGANVYTLTFSGGGTASFRYIFSDKWR